MKHLYFCLLVFAFATPALAQVLAVNPVADRKLIWICKASTTVMSNSPLWVTNGVVVNGNTIRDYIRPSSIQSMNVLKDASATAIYGTRGQHGVVTIELRKDLKLWSLKDLFKNFRIRKKNWNLPVFIDAKELVNQADFFIVNDIVASVKVVAVEDELAGKNKVIKISLKPL